MNGLGDVVGRWVRERLVDAVSLETGRWFGARLDWPPEHLRRAWTQEWDSVHARAACRVTAAAHKGLSGEAAQAVGGLLRPCGDDPAPRVCWLGMPSAYVCGCELPHHARGIARCEWNEVRGWRPREREEVTDG